MFYEFNGYVPVVHPSAFVHPQANVTGDVVIGADVYIGPGAVLRGDWGQIIVEEGCNVQENCVVHLFPGKSAVLRKGAHIGHGAIIHGALVEENALIGMNAVLMDDVVIGAGSIVGALCFVPAETIIPPRSLVVGNPARILREVSDEQLAWKTEGTRLYQQLPAECRSTLRECQPLTELPPDRPPQSQRFQTWNRRKNS